MRTTVTIDDDVLAVARALAQRDGGSLGSALSTLARRGFRNAAIDDDDEDDLPTFRVTPDSAPITSEDVRKALSDWP
ncbi:MAG: hypothetical protein OXH96_19015 [Spirochaetaceae bacterium]|nr:hypothetical protein [Spirochaetaceae bacterium]